MMQYLGTKPNTNSIGLCFQIFKPLPMVGKFLKASSVQFFSPIHYSQPLGGNVRSADLSKAA